MFHLFQMSIEITVVILLETYDEGTHLLLHTYI